MTSTSMKAALLLMTIGVTLADLHSSISTVQTSASGIKQKVDTWTSSSGITSALSIQDSFGTFTDAVNALSTDSKSVTSQNIDTNEIQKLSNSINTLLASLANKCNDFKTVGVQQIVANDISAVSKPTLDIVNTLAKAVSSDCTKAKQLEPSLQMIGKSFNAVNKLYGLPAVQFPTSIQCKPTHNVRVPSSDQLSASAQSIQGSSTQRSTETSPPQEGPSSSAQTMNMPPMVQTPMPMAPIPGSGPVLPKSVQPAMVGTSSLVSGSMTSSLPSVVTPPSSFSSSINDSVPTTPTNPMGQAPAPGSPNGAPYGAMNPASNQPGMRAPMPVTNQSSNKTFTKPPTPGQVPLNGAGMPPVPIGDKLNSTVPFRHISVAMANGAAQVEFTNLLAAAAIVGMLL